MKLQRSVPCARSIASSNWIEIELLKGVPLFSARTRKKGHARGRENARQPREIPTIERARGDVCIPIQPFVHRISRLFCVSTNPSIITWNRKKLNKIIRNDSRRDELLGRDRKFGMEGIIPRDWNNCNGNCSNATKDYSFDYNLHPRTLRRQTNVAIKHSLSFEGSRIFQSEDKMKTRLNTKFHFFGVDFTATLFTEDERNAR